MKKCIICPKEIHPERLATDSNILTCCAECSARHHQNQVNQAKVRYRERLKQRRKEAVDWLREGE